MLLCDVWRHDNITIVIHSDHESLKHLKGQLKQKNIHAKLE
jgi:hypothetical protein